MDDNKQEDPVMDTKGISIVIKVTDEQASIFEAAIARGELKQFGITNARTLSSEEAAALAGKQWRTMEHERRLPPDEDAKTPPRRP